MDYNDGNNYMLEIVKDKLYFVNVGEEHFKPPTGSQKYHPDDIYFCTDNTLVYTAFFADYGPLDLGLTYTFCKDLHEKMDSISKITDGSNAETITGTGRKSTPAVYYYCSKHPHRRANSAVLLLAYTEAYLPFYGFGSEKGPLVPVLQHAPGKKPTSASKVIPFINFRDAAFCVNSFPITVLDCACAFHRVNICKHFSFNDFSLKRYQELNKLQNGDVTWIVPNKLIAFSGPVSKRRVVSEGVYSLRPEEYIPLFKNLGVTCIVRFNTKCYDRQIYVNAGIRHVDLYYEDGGNPSDAILQSFLTLCESERGAIAVHCKAGLGRTGTNIAAYMIKHYGYTAKEASAWSRVCRPGCVVGPQQQYLMSVQARLFEEGEQFRERLSALRGAGQSNSNPSRNGHGRNPMGGSGSGSDNNGQFNSKLFSALRPQGGSPLSKSEIDRANEVNAARPNTSAGVVSTTGRYSDAATQQRQQSNGNGAYRQLLGVNKTTSDGNLRDKLPAQRSPNSVRNPLVISNNYVGNETGGGGKMPSLSQSNTQNSQPHGNKHGGTSFGSEDGGGGGSRRPVYQEPVNRPSTSSGVTSSHNSALRPTRNNANSENKSSLVASSYYNRSSNSNVHSQRGQRSSSNSSAYNTRVNTKTGRPVSSYTK